MNCETMQQKLLAHGWNEAERLAMAEALGHEQTCPSCRAALADYDQLQAALRLPVDEMEPPDGWAAFGDRLLTAARAGKHRPGMRMRGFALAASILLALAGWGLYWQSTLRDTGPGQFVAGPNGVSASVKPLTPGEITERVRAFREVAEVFENRASWVLVADRASDLGLTTEPAINPGRLLLMRLRVDRGGEALSVADVMILPGRKAELELPAGKGPSLRYRITTSAEDPRHLQFCVELRPQGEKTKSASILATSLDIRPGEPTALGQLMTTAGRYDLTVELYPADLQAQTL